MEKVKVNRIKNILIIEYSQLLKKVEQLKEQRKASDPLEYEWYNFNISQHTEKLRFIMELYRQIFDADIVQVAANYFGSKERNK